MTIALARIALVALLASAAIAKLARPRSARSLLVAARLPRLLVWPAVALELCVAGWLASGREPRLAGAAAIVLGGAFVSLIATARLRGTPRFACGCFGGARERHWTVLALRALVVPVLALPLVGVAGPSRELAVALVLAALSLAVAALAVLVLALYRQVGVLQRRVLPQGFLEIAHEGPAVGEAAPELAQLRRAGDEVVFFASQSCRVCRQLEPGARALARSGIPVHELFEHEDAAAFARWGVPGTPFIVHVIDGTVAAKGLVNTLEQLDELVETGTRREELHVVR